jgi:hypothetical protein
MRPDIRGPFVVAVIAPGGRRMPGAGRQRMRCDVLGYPAGWPAGPWVVPLFWLTVVIATGLVRWLG